MKKEKILAPSITMLVLFILSSCDKMPDQGDPIQYTSGSMGTVFDKQTNQSIDSAWVRAYNPNIDRLFSTYTDSSGEYILAFYIESDSQQIINIGKSGYITIDTLIRFSIPQNNFKTVNIYLTPE